MAPIGRFLIVCGLVLVGAGLVLTLSDRIPWLGRLPGDISIRRDHFTFHFPLATCILVSIILSVVLWIFRR